jgi:hypothetical protein
MFDDEYVQKEAINESMFRPMCMSTAIQDRVAHVGVGRRMMVVMH